MVLGPVQDILKVLLEKDRLLLAVIAKKGHLISEFLNSKEKHQPLACAIARGDQGTLVHFVHFVLTLLKFRVQSPVLLIL